jgi:hypothetical protein
MSTTFDPSKEGSLHLLGHPACTNGKAELSLSQASARPDFWRKRAPKELRQEGLSADEATSVYWSKRRPPTSIAELCGAADTPLRWALAPGAISALSSNLLDFADKVSSLMGRRAMAKKKAKLELQAALTRWLDAAKTAPPSYDLAVGCLAAAHLLDGAGGIVAPALAWRILDQLADTAGHAPTWNLGANAEPDEVLAVQMLGGELPLTLAYLFSEMKPLVKGARSGSNCLSDSILELLNGEGLPRGAHLSVMRPLLACWTRCRAISKEIEAAGLAKKARRQYEWLVRQSLRWTAPDGTQLLAGEGSDEWPSELLRAALRLGGSDKDAAAARELLGKKAAKGADKKGPKAAYNCEWAGLSVLRSGWSPGDAVVAIDYSRPEMRLEVWAGKRRLLGGAISAESRIDGKQLRPTGAWEELCWFKDKDVNYLELSLPLQDGTRLERQILLALRDEFVLVADHLQHSQRATLEHVVQAPLGARLLFCGEGETRDAVLVDGEPLARLMPLGLPEWRIDPRVGELSYSGGALRLAEKSEARSLACPLFIDLRGDRAGQQSTWRQLTVAELLQIQPSDVAVSYRIQSGDDQWVYYRSQGPRGNRTFLGQNTSSECLVARFKSPTGKIRTLLEIEG